VRREPSCPEPKIIAPQSSAPNETAATSYRV